MTASERPFTSMTDRRTFWYVLVGVIVSLALHGTVLIPALIAILQAQPPAATGIRAHFSPDDFRRPDQPDDAEQQVPLGIDESQVSTMTWIGYEDYQEHLAALAEQDQAAFTTEPTGEDPDTPPMATTPMQDTPPPQDPQQTGEPSPAARVDGVDDADPIDQIETWLAATTPGPGPIEGAAENPAAPPPEAVESALEKLEVMIAQQPAETRQEQPQPQPAQAADPAPVAAGGTPADQSDRESDPFSTVEVPIDQIHLGRPMAANGLMVKPVKPTITTLTSVTSAPANPTVELQFGRDGKPRRCRVVETSYDPRIDQAILNSLYRWRAAGNRLKELHAGETIPVRIQIVLREQR